MWRPRNGPPFFMPKKAKQPEVEVVNNYKEMELVETLRTQRFEAEQYIAKQRDDSYCSWDEKEALLLGRPLDRNTASSKSQVFDPRLSTITLERAARVTAQIPTGKVQSLTRADTGKNILLNLALQKYIVPNADSQFDLLTKFRMWDMYSLVYGSFAILADYRIDDNYIGPDAWLIPIRYLKPQAGITNKNEADYMFVDAWVSLGWLKSRNKETWKNLDQLIRTVQSEGGKPRGSIDQNQKSYSEKLFMDNQYGGKGDYAQVLLSTRYERDKWVTFAPDFPDIGPLRSIRNPQKNNTIPIVVKHAFPLLDRFMGLGEFERGKTLQYATNSLINLYLDGVKMSIFPPIISDPNGVVPSSIKYQAAARWLETKPNSIRQFQLSPRGTETFQSTYSFLIAAMLNQAGTTDTTVTKDSDITQGKTPMALRYLAARESARDNWDRFMMEKAIEETFNIFVDLLVTRQEKPIDLYLFKKEIEQVRQVYPDVVEIFDSGEFGKVSIKKGVLQNTKYRFYIDAGTTMKKDESVENQSLTDILTLILKVPQLLQQITRGVIQIGKLSLDFGELLKRWLITSGVQDWEKIIRELTPEEMQGLSGGANGQPAGDSSVMPGSMPGAHFMTPPGESGAPGAGQPTGIDTTQFEDPQIRQLAEAIASYGNSSPNR